MRVLVLRRFCHPSAATDCTLHAPVRARSYTTFKYGKASVKRDFQKDDRARQRTNEAFAGKGGLYDRVL